MHQPVRPAANERHQILIADAGRTWLELLCYVMLQRRHGAELPSVLQPAQQRLPVILGGEEVRFYTRGQRRISTLQLHRAAALWAQDVTRQSKAGERVHAAALRVGAQGS